MDAEEAKACSRVLVAIAMADGKIDPDERRLIELCGGDAHPAAVDLEVELAKLHSPDAKERALRAAIAVAEIDGHCSLKERHMLELIHARIGEGGALTLLPMHAETRAHVEEVREALEEATIEFLHAVGSKGHDLSQKAYEALAAELEKKKRALLEGTLREGD